MSMFAAYLLPGKPEPVDGETIATGLGWKGWTDWVLSDPDTVPHAAHLAQEGWVEGSDELEELAAELLHLVHEAPDPDPSAVTAQVLAAVRSRPSGTRAVLVTDGDDGDDEEKPTLESHLLEHGFTGEIKDSAGRTRHYVDGKEVAAPKAGGEGKPKSIGDASAAVAKVADETTEELAKGNPEVAGQPGVWGKVKGLVHKATERVNQFMLDNAGLVGRVGQAWKLIDSVLTTPEDLQKNPALMGKLGPADVSGDVLQSATALQGTLFAGVPGQLAAKVVAAVVVKSWGLAKKAMGITESVETAPNLGDVAEFLAGLVNAAAEDLGVKVDASEIRKWLESQAGKS